MDRPRRPHRPAIFAVAIALGVAVPGAAAGQDASVRAYLTPGGAVGVGRPFTINLEVTGAGRLDAEPPAPDLTPFAQYLGSGTSTSVRMVGGRTSTSVTIQYRYQSLREGTHAIPALEVRVGGRSLATEALALTVSAAPPAAGGSAGTDEGGPNDPFEVSGSELFLTAEASRARVRDGEPLVVEYRIWTRVDVTSYTLTHVPEPQGFWVEDVTPAGSPTVEQVTRDAREYATAVIRRIALVPTGTGTRTLEPLGLEAQVRTRRGRDLFDNFFGGRSLFGTSVVPTTVLSNPVTVEVVPLPPGRPEPFSGVVGSLDLSATLDRDSVAANEALTLTVRASVRGNVRAVSAPVPDLPPDFEIFPPEVSESMRPSSGGLAGTKTFSYVLIPRAPGSRRIPPISLGYFDPEADAYRTASTDPIPFTVTGTVPVGPGSVARGGVAQLREDVRFIRLGSPDLRRTGRILFEGSAFWIVLLLPAAAAGGGALLRRHQDRLAGDVAYARARRAGRVARRRLSAARRLAGADDARAFYAEVARALRGLAADKLNRAEAGVRTDDIEAALRRAGVREETVAELSECLAHCDRHRFAPAGSGGGERERFLARAAELMTAVDREVRR